MEVSQDRFCASRVRDGAVCAGSGFHKLRRRYRVKNERWCNPKSSASISTKSGGCDE